LLPLRCRAQENWSGPDREIRAAGDHRVGRSNADQEAMADLETLILVEASVLGDEGGAKGQRLRRQRHDDVDLPAVAQGGAEPKRDSEGKRSDQTRPFEHCMLPIYRSVLMRSVNRKRSALQLHPLASAVHRISTVVSKGIRQQERR
jgi:hypothetical protein